MTTTVDAHGAAAAKRIVFAVCHPDDEALWIGATLAGLAASPGLRCYVVCLSGNDRLSPRADEFAAARAIAGYDAGVVLGGPLRSALEPLPDIASTLEEGLAQLGIRSDEVDLLITHSPYGDEHGNPHHVQAYLELQRWAGVKQVSFGFFSCLPVPHCSLQPLLTSFRRGGTSFHLLNLARCKPRANSLLRAVDRRLKCPAFYVQFAGNLEQKTAMLEAYESIDLEAHRQGYSSWTTACESLYLMDSRGLAALQPALDALDTPGPADLFASLRMRPSLRRAVAAKIRKGA